MTFKKLSLHSNSLLSKTGIRNYSTQEATTNFTDNEINTAEVKPVKFYEDAYTMKLLILNENKNKPGIYRFTNKLSGSFYIGSAKNLRARLYSYYLLSALLRGKNNTIISRALIKYGYSNFTLEILEYCEVSELLEREQYYLDLLKPDYNIAKVAGSTIGIPRTEEFKQYLSDLRKGKIPSEETKILMSISHSGSNNSMFGKKHTDQSKELMRNARLGRVLDIETKNAISASNGSPICLYALCSDCSTEKYCLVKQFFSFREAGKYLNKSHSYVSRYLKSGKLISRIDGKYKFTNSLLEN
jgi:group I intron endonuclease